MDIREIIKRLEDIESKARDKKQFELEDSVGTLIEDIIENDIEEEKQFRKEVSKYIDDKIEKEIVRRAYSSGSIAQA
jgi:hypothetical protein